MAQSDGGGLAPRAPLTNLWVDPLALRGLFAPKAVALVGATQDRSRFGGKVFDRLERFGGGATLYPVNPSATEIRGTRCYPSLRDLPEAPDHVAIAVPAKAMFDVLADCESIGARFVTVFSGGFAETGTEDGKVQQTKLTAFAQRTGIRILGPNCNGLVNFVDGFALTSSATVTVGKHIPGNIGLVAQSGGLAQVNVMWRAQELGLGLSYEVSCGNCADLDVLSLMRFMIADDHTDVIMVVAEGLSSGEELFSVAAEAADRRKPIVMLKLGRTPAGSRAAASHTGAITGSDQVHDAAFRQCEIIRVDDCDALYETAMMLRSKRIPLGRRAAALSISGGNAVLLADLGAREGLEWPDYTPTTQSALGELLPKQGIASNPTDVSNAVVGHVDLYGRCIKAIAADENVDTVVPIVTFGVRTDIEQVAEALGAIQKPAAVLWTGGCSNDPNVTPSRLIERGLAVYRDTLSCVRAIRGATRYGEFLTARSVRGTLPIERPLGINVEAARRICEGQTGPLTERVSKQVLAAYGFPVTQEVLAKNADEAVLAARAMGAPVAMKIESKQILHKTEAGAIRLGVSGDEAVRAAFAQVSAAAASYDPSAVIDGVIVQEMAPAGGLELILGVTKDSVFGPVIMVGLGGIHVEVLKDVAFMIPPVDARQAEGLLRELRAFPLFEGVRGQAPRDMSAICDLVRRLSWLAHDLRDRLVELDINPVLVYETGRAACVVDALISLS